MTAAKRKYSQFHGFASTKRTAIDIDLSGDLVYLGRALDIAYNSDKWDKTPKNYRHEFDKDDVLLCNAAGNVLIIVGPKLKVKSHGIID